MLRELLLLLFLEKNFNIQEANIKRMYLYSKCLSGRCFLFILFSCFLTADSPLIKGVFM